MDKANHRAISDPLAQIPPLKLNPFSSGYSTPMGDPAMKKTTTVGTKNRAMLGQRVGSKTPSE